MRRRTVFVFIGPPGSGKGSLSRLCSQNLGWKQVSTGNLCRKHIGKQTEIGKKIDFAIKSGKLVSDDLITQMVCDWFLQNEEEDAVILDGYPRTIVQAQLFEKLAQNMSAALSIVIVKFSIKDAVVVDRLSNRYVCQNKECQAVYSLKSGSALQPNEDGICDVCNHSIGRRSDDKPEAVVERLRTYYQHEQVLLDFYKKSGRPVHEFGTNKPLEQLFHQFKDTVGDLVV